MKITQVERQRKNINRHNVFLDGVFAFGADEDLIVEYRLIVGKVIDAPLLEKLLFEAEVGKLMERMYDLWNVRPRSEKEVRDYLRSLSFKRKVKGKEEVSQAAVNLLVEKLKQKRLLNDQEFAKEWVKSRRRSKYKSNRAITAELLQKGVDRNIIVEALEEESDQTKLAEKTLEKKTKSWQSFPYLEKKKKGYEFLLRRGFEYEVVKVVIEKFLQKS